MKKIVMLLLIALCSSPVVMAQSFDDLYYVPKKEEPQKKKVESRKENRDRTSVSSGIPVVVKDRNGKVRNADEYNRRYDASDNNFEVKNDTLYVEEQENADRGRWVNGFNGSADDYEYAQRIIRFRNPRFAVSISSPYYWDIVYGVNSWDWNVYTDDYYAYAFPTFSNRLWWDWRYGSYGSLGIGFGWNYPFYNGYYGGSFYGSAWGNGYYGGGYWGGGYYGGSYWGSGYWGNNHWGHGSYANNNVYYNNRSSRYGNSYSRPSSRSYESYRGGSYSGSSRVVGTRSEGYSTSRRVTEYVRPSSTRSSGSEWDNSRRTTYTRPSSTRYSSESESRRTSSNNYNREPVVRSGTYNRGSSSSSNTYNSGGSTSRRTTYENSTPSRQTYTPSSRSSESYRSSGNSGGGGASRSRR